MVRSCGHRWFERPAPQVLTMTQFPSHFPHLRVSQGMWPAQRLAEGKMSHKCSWSFASMVPDQQHHQPRCPTFLLCVSASFLFLPTSSARWERRWPVQVAQVYQTPHREPSGGPSSQPHPPTPRQPVCPMEMSHQPFWEVGAQMKEPGPKCPQQTATSLSSKH